LQVTAAFQDHFLPRVVVSLKKEIKRLSASDAVISVDMARLGDEEGAAVARPDGGGGDGSDEARATRKSEKVRAHSVAKYFAAFCMGQHNVTCAQRHHENDSLSAVVACQWATYLLVGVTSEQVYLKTFTLL
jgi:hypothetical protein